MLKGKTSLTERISNPQSSTVNNRASFLRFITDDGREFGFPFSQLLQFILDPNPDPKAPQRLLLAFSSHDVTVTGCRLDLLCEQLDQHNAIRLRADDQHFASLHPDEPFVAGISISSVSASWQG